MQTPKKRKGTVGEEIKAKKARTNNNIKKYISCKRWREEEASLTTPPRPTTPTKDSPVNGEQTGHYIDRVVREPTPGEERKDEGKKAPPQPSNISRESRILRNKPSMQQRLETLHNQRTVLSRGSRLDTTLTGCARGREQPQEMKDWLKESR